MASPPEGNLEPEEGTDLPDAELINYLCDNVLEDYIVNKEILLNWQVQLADSVQDLTLLQSIIEHDLVLQHPSNTSPSCISKAHVSKFLERLQELENEVYYEFKIIVLEVFACVMSALYSTKLKLSKCNILEVFLQWFLVLLGDLPAESLCSTPMLLLVHQFCKLITLFCELGCGIKEVRKLVLPLFLDSYHWNRKAILLDLLNQIFSLYPCHFGFFVLNDFQRSAIAIPFKNELKSSKCLTIQSWFKINKFNSDSRDDRPSSAIDLFMLSSSSSRDIPTLKVRLLNYNQFVMAVEDESHDNNLRLSFNQLLNSTFSETQGFVHFVLTYDNYKNLNLYLNGEYSESIPCPDLHKTLNMWDKVYIGNETLPPMLINRDELILRSLSIYNTSLNYEWISNIYNHGLAHEWHFKGSSDNNLSENLESLSYRQLFNICFKIDELQKGRRNESKLISNIIGNSSKLVLKSSKSTVDFSSKVKQSIISSLRPIKPNEDNVLFDLTDYSRQKDSNFPEGPKIQFHKKSSIHAAFYSLGGTSILLAFIDLVCRDLPPAVDAMEDLLLLKALSLLFNLLNNNWRLNKEFENSNGYGVLLILLTFYKNKRNKSSKSKTSSQSDCQKTDTNDTEFLRVLEMALSHAGYDSNVPYESAIFNQTAFKNLVLNFDLFSDLNDLQLLLQLINILLVESKFSSFNTSELSKMKLLKKLIQFLKSPTLLEKEFTPDQLEQISKTFGFIISTNPSVDVIRSTSLFIDYLLYRKALQNSIDLGRVILFSLTNNLCNSSSSMKILKKFTRSINLHWILLLLDFREPEFLKESKDIVKCGIRLLTKLLKALGMHTSKRFFLQNFGLDILTKVLKTWWTENDILCLIYVSSFDLELDDFEDLNLTLSQIHLESSGKLNLVFPDYLLLLNNVVLSGLNELNTNFGRPISATNSPLRLINVGADVLVGLNVLHLINQYSDSIDNGFESSASLKCFYLNKGWLEGVIEIIAHLKLSLTWSHFSLTSSFEKAHKKMKISLRNIFLTKLVSSHGFLEIVDALSDMNKKIMLSEIFPEIFEHLSQFVKSSNFIFRETEILNSTIETLNYHYTNFVEQNFLVSEQEIDSFVDCSLAVIDSTDLNRSSFKIQNDVKKLKKYLGNIVLLKVFHLLNEDLRQNLNSPRRRKNSTDLDFILGSKPDPSEVLIEISKWLLYRQVIILNSEVLGNDKLTTLICILLGTITTTLKDSEDTNFEYVLNFLRSCYMMRESDFKTITELLSDSSGYSEAESLFKLFFDTLMAKNDDETIRQLQKYPTYRHIFIQCANLKLSPYRELSMVNVNDMISVTLNNGGSLELSNNKFVNNCEQECEQLKSSIINTELMKFNRGVQDKQENNQFFTSVYNSLKIEVFRLLGLGRSSEHYILDYIQNSDCMRKRMIVESQLPESEGLSYEISIPMKYVEPIDDEVAMMDKFDLANSTSRLDSLSISTDDQQSEEPDDGYELIDEISDSLDSDFEDKNRKVIRSLYMGDTINSIWNVSQINGLVPVESLMILGSNHLYLIENYFHSKDGNVIDVEDAPVEEKDPYLQLINSQSSGYLNGENSKTHRSKSWGLAKLSSISKRQFLLRDVALEMFFDDGASILITCLTNRERDLVYQKLHLHASGKGLDYDLLQALLTSSSLTSTFALNNGTYFLASKIASALSKGHNSIWSITKKWKMGEISNFYYLMIINTLAGRTYNDLTQYPVFPWVIADYTSEELDMSNPRTFRDLSKPMGGQTNARASQFKERYEALDSLNDPNSPPFHYGTHYSSAMIVTSYLIRLKPYVQSYLLLQGGKFDHADRLFNSVEKAWNSASRDNTTDVRELTPEFFYLSEFLTNSNQFEFGVLQNGEASNDVVLPPWAKGDPKIFIHKNREVLESPYVSANLHLWIDLVFGHKQSGIEAVKSLNVFHHLSYNGAIDLDNINDELERRAVTGMINNFGQTPIKIFQKQHPKRDVLNLPNHYLEVFDLEQKPKLLFDSKYRIPIRKLEMSQRSKRWVGRPDCVCNEDDLLIRKENLFEGECGSIIVNKVTFRNIHLSNITCILPLGHKLFMTGSSDGIINVWKHNARPNPSLQFQSILRGHFASVSTMKYSRSFKTGISIDIEGNVLVWDLSRYKFMRKICPPQPGLNQVLGTISNDTGNIILLYNNKINDENNNNSNMMKIFTINGELVLTHTLSPGTITSINCATINSPSPTGDSDAQLMFSSHIHWSNEVIAISHAYPSRYISILELVCDGEAGSLWHLKPFRTFDLSQTPVANITAMEIFKKATIDLEDKLSRGRLDLVLGDSVGKVYGW